MLHYVYRSSYIEKDNTKCAVDEQLQQFLKLLTSSLAEKQIHKRSHQPPLHPNIVYNTRQNIPYEPHPGYSFSINDQDTGMSSTLSFER